MKCKNIKYPILFSFLFFAGSAQGGYAQEASEVETGPGIQQASFTPPFDFPIVFPVTSVRYAPITFTAGWTSRPAEP